jgi:hypothetical protein
MEKRSTGISVCDLHTDANESKRERERFYTTTSSDVFMSSLFCLHLKSHVHSRRMNTTSEQENRPNE